MTRHSTNGLVDTFIEELDKELKLGLSADLARTNLAIGIEASEGKAGVDRNTKTIFGVAIATKGPALGHDMVLDDVFMEQLEEAGNSLKQGVKARFDHPNMSNTSMGTAIGRFKAFRRDGDVVRADLSFFKSAEKAPEGNYPEYLMELAEEAPQAFGTSIVFQNEPVEQLNEDGEPVTDKKGNPLPRLARLKKLYAADVVDEPAANPNGFFSTPTQQSLAAKLTGFLDRYFQNHGVSLQPRQSKEESKMSEATKVEEKKAVEVTITDKTEVLSAEDILKNERERVNTIREFGATMNCPEDKLKEFIAQGTSVVEAFTSIGAYAKEQRLGDKQQTLTQLSQTNNESAGGSLDGIENHDGAGLSVQDQAKKKFASDPKVRDEFIEESYYVAYCEGKAEGRVNIVGSKAAI